MKRQLNFFNDATFGQDEIYPSTGNLCLISLIQDMALYGDVTFGFGAIDPERNVEILDTAQNIPKFIF